MYSKFLDNEIVIVNGIGKCNNQYYKNKKASIICRDPYYGDYNVRFEDGNEDWLDAECLKSVVEKKKRKRKKKKRRLKQ